MKQFRIASFRNLLWLFVGAISLASCGGSGGGGGSSDTGSGQKPDPVVVDFPIAYIERTFPSVDVESAKLDPIYPYEDALKPAAFFPGARVMIKDRATNLATPVDITKDVFKDDPNYDPAVLAKGYDVKDLSASSDGTKLLFSMRAPFDKKAKKGMGPKWHIYEYDLKTKQTPRAIIMSDIVAQQGEDVSPHYLPDGRILFSSTRQIRSKAVLLDDGKPQFSALEESGKDAAFELHSMKDDGSDIQQLTYNQSHDIQPTVLQNGRIFYSRWDQLRHDNFSFYTANADGTDVQRNYGFLSMNIKPVVMTDPINRLMHPQEMLDGRIVAILKPDGALLGGDMVVVDTKNFFENDAQVPGGSGTGTGQNPISILPISIKVGVDEVSQHGRFAGVTPLYDGTNRLLVSWSQCRLQEITTKKIVACTDNLLVNGKAVLGYVEADPLFSLWIYNMADQSQQPVALTAEGKMLTNPVTLEVRDKPAYIQPQTDVDLAKESVGMLHIRSVYDMDGTFNNYGNMAFTSLNQIAQAAPDARPARFVRLIKAVSIPDKITVDALGDNTYAQLFNNLRNLHEILGYAPVEPDGSVKIKVPADVAFTLEVLDKDGKRIGAAHNAWLQIRPGETRECSGCHVATNLTSGHGRANAELASINAGATSAMQFINTIRTDALGTPDVPKLGETMAEFASHTTYCLIPGDTSTCVPFSSKSANLRAPSVDLVFDDEWTDPTSSGRAKTASFAYRYSDLAPTKTDIHSPTSAACMETDGWTSLCRIIINYESHIQPLWERARPVLSGTTVVGNNGCTTCHAPTKDIPDPMDATKTITVNQIPAGQLSLLRTKGAAGQEMISYTNLLNGSDMVILDANNNPQTLIPVCTLAANTYGIPICTAPPVDSNGKPTCAGVTVCQFVLDTNTADPFDLLLDSTGNVIPLTSTVAITATMSRGGARASANFFNKFAMTGTHFGYLNNSELKLLAEWLDLGGQYYNNPFDSIEP